MMLPFQGKCWHCGHDHDAPQPMSDSFLRVAITEKENEYLRTQLAQAESDKAELVRQRVEIWEKFADMDMDYFDAKNAILSLLLPNE